MSYFFYLMCFLHFILISRLVKIEIAIFYFFFFYGANCFSKYSLVNYCFEPELFLHDVIQYYSHFNTFKDFLHIGAVSEEKTWWKRAECHITSLRFLFSGHLFES